MISISSVYLWERERAREHFQATKTENTVYPCYPLTCCVNAYWRQWLLILGTLNWSISVFTDVLCYCEETLCQVSSPLVLGLWDFSGEYTARDLRHNKQLTCNSSELCLPPLFFPMQIVLHSLFEMQKEAQVWWDKQESKRSTWWRGHWERQIWKEQQPHRWSRNDSAWIAWGLELSKSPLSFSPFGPSSTWYSEASTSFSFFLFLLHQKPKPRCLGAVAQLGTVLPSSFTLESEWLP